ncbi:MAG: hypothetical protein OXR73_13135 [Myxococcales bacterium]|nr:hypothetical protein [Myxococcales bacterium]
MNSATDVTELADACVAYVKRSLQLELDYSQDTLPLLDHYLHEAANQARTNRTPEAVLAPLIPTAGAYFGQLVVHQFPGCRFHAPGDDYGHYRVEFSPFFLHFNPLGIAHEVLLGEDAPGWHAHFAVLDEAKPVVEQSLSTSLALREQDYYSFSVRYETLEQVVAVLSALEEQRPGPPRTFSADVYEGAVGNRTGNEG